MAALVSIALVATACGGPSASPTAHAPDDKALAFAQCMRAHGVPAFPDPGKPVADNLDENSPAFLRASTLCDRLTHNPPGHNSPAHEQQMLNSGLKLAECIRAHGVPDFPDPTMQGGSLSFDVPAGDVHSAQLQAAQRICRAKK